MVLAVPLPGLGNGQVLFAVENFLLSVEAPPRSGLPHADMSFQPLVQCLDIDNVICLFTAILLERRVLLRAYDKNPETTFQSLIRLPKHVHDRKLKPSGKPSKPVLYDHRSLELNTNDFQRTCKIPKKKGANFRDLAGIIILPDGTVDVERKNRQLLPSGKPLAIIAGYYCPLTVNGSKFLGNMLFFMKSLICLTSNVRSGSVHSVSDHHFGALLKANHPTVLCTNDPGLFGTCLSQEYSLATSFGLLEVDFLIMGKNAVNSIISEEQLRLTLQELFDNALMNTAHQLK